MKSSIITRKCILCGKRIKIEIDNRTHKYNNGHYFGKMKFPIGKGKYKICRTAKLLGKKTNVVKWSGKEKEIEYWECNKCNKSD